MAKMGDEWEASVRLEAKMVEGSGEGTEIGGPNPVAGWRMLPVSATIDRNALPLFHTGPSDRKMVESRNLCLYLLRVGRSPVERATIFAWYDVGGLCAIDKAERRSVKALWWLKNIEGIHPAASTVRALDFALRARPLAAQIVKDRVAAKGPTERAILEAMQARARACDRANKPRRKLRLMQE
jgi:hypothetical protein